MEENILFGEYYVLLLVNVKKLEYEQSYILLKIWLDNCSQLKFDFSINNELNNRLKNVKHFYPLSYNKLIDENKKIFNLIEFKKVNIRLQTRTT